MVYGLNFSTVRCPCFFFIASRRASARSQQTNFGAFNFLTGLVLEGMTSGLVVLGGHALLDLVKPVEYLYFQSRYWSARRHGRSCSVQWALCSDLDVLHDNPPSPNPGEEK